ncbi:MAG: bifunctional transaldolase/phosoglucose isomerase [Candidatus Binatia bacterium]
MARHIAPGPTNPLVELLTLGQSVWYDNISRDLIDSGELQRMIDGDGLRGVTSNPTIFEKAVTGSAVYKQQVQELLCEGKETEAIYETLAVQDIQAAADLLLPVYEASAGVDGYVSLEVPPSLAHDTAATVAEARRLRDKVGRKNLMVKVPATPAGLSAIEQLVGGGVSINVTLIFSLAHYLGVAEAYLRGLEALEKGGRPLGSVASVASVFVSRIDSAVDKILAPNREAWEFLGKAGVANAKVIYGKFREIFGGGRFARLKSKGARPQRPLWASTGVKNPRYSDVLYAEELIGADTVDTMPPATLSAFKDHGVPASRLEKDIEAAPWVIDSLAQFGIEFEEITEKLQKDGVQSFAKSWEQLMKGIEAQAEGAVCAIRKASVIRYRPWLNEVYQMMEDRRVIPRVWERDPTLWHHQPAHHAIIRNSLGWLTVADTMLERIEELTSFADEIQAAGFTHALLLGMGGSSLCPDVCRQTFATRPGRPELRVLDTTDPAMIARLSQGLDLEKTVFLVSSKSGGTPESVYLQAYFYDRLRRAMGDRAGANFVAITDPGTSLERLAHQQQFRRVFLNFKDIGGRYSALSYFGMVPAALIGVDVHALLSSAQRMAQQCRPSGAARDAPPKTPVPLPALANPGAQLGALLGELALHGRDKLTLVLSPSITSYGYWIEQLIAESTGKEGRGILPVEGEDLDDPAVYGRDRVFVALELPGSAPSVDVQLFRLESAGHPVVRITVPDPIDLGAEFFRWEFATAIAGALIAVDPFDQPNVQESKDNTKRLIEQFRRTGKLPPAHPDPVAALAPFLKQAHEFDYVAILAYLDRNPPNQQALQRLRMAIRNRYHVATTVGFGPRFLHSTGQLHKGGSNNGLFVQITAVDANDLPIPGEPFSFGVLKQAQALGDLESLRQAGRRVIHIHFRGDLRDGFKQLAEAVS